MEIVDRSVYLGPNLYALFRVIRVVLDLEDQAVAVLDR